MILIVGLGNPGEKYKKTRHNVGFMVVDKINKKLKIKYQKHILKIKKHAISEVWETKMGSRRVILAKPLTFVNSSGGAVKKLATSYPGNAEDLRRSLDTLDSSRVIGPRSKHRDKLQATSLILVHDDLDIPLGKFKIQFAKGPREHKGVESVEKALKTKDFWRVRVGIENRKKEWPDGYMVRWLKQDERISGEEYVLQEFTEEERKVIDEVILKVVEGIQKRLLTLIRYRNRVSEDC